jgi:hypothetical protein
VASAGATSAEACPTGQFQNETGQTACIVAPQGSCVPTTGATVALVCDAGTFQNLLGQLSCKTATAGTFVAVTGAAAAVQSCPVGAYQSQVGQTSCITVPAGAFVARVGATEMQLCSTGTYQDLTGQSACKLAPINFFVDQTGATAAMACLAGTVQSLAGQNSCDDELATLCVGPRSGAIRLKSNEIIELPVHDICLTTPEGTDTFVPSSATAASSNVTAVSPASAGFVTVWPCGVIRPLSSNLNYVADSVVPNGVIASIRGSGSVCLFGSSDTDLVVDIAGWFEGDALMARRQSV